MSEYNIQMNKYNALNAEYDQLYPVTKIEDVDGLDTALQNKADKSVAFTVSLTVAGWSNNAQTVSNAKFLPAGYAYTVAPASSSFADYADAMVYADDVTTNGQMVFHCDSAPTADLTVNIVRMVTAE